MSLLRFPYLDREYVTLTTTSYYSDSFCNSQSTSSFTKLQPLLLGHLKSEKGTNGSKSNLICQPHIVQFSVSQLPRFLAFMRIVPYHVQIFDRK